jgi:uncharacterized protein (TIGR02391 family)
MDSTLSQFRRMNALPEREELLKYSPEEAAQLVLRLLPKNNVAFIPGDLLGGINEAGYGRDAGVERVLMEGVAYLERYGLLVEDIRRYSGTGRGRVLSRQGEELAKSSSMLTEFITSIKDPRALLHPSIIANAMPLYERGPQFFDSAISAALKSVEVSVRQTGGYNDSDLVVQLMRRAFGEGGPLRNLYNDPGEENGYRELFGGAIAVYKNSASHRYVDWRDSLSVLRILIFASELLHTVEYRTSDVLWQEAEQARNELEDGGV